MKKIVLSIVAFMAIVLNVKAADPLYTAKGSVGVYESWSTATCLFPSADGVTVEVYSDSVIVRSWCGVEGYDVVAKWDADGNFTDLYPVVNGKANPYSNGGYYYVDTGIETPGYWMVAAYLGSGFSYVWDGGMAISCYAYKDSAYKQSDWGYYYVSWEVPTGISSLHADTLPSESPLFNLAGQRVSKGTKGLVISNGKKYIAK